MKVKYQGITNEQSALKAVEQNGDALQYVRDQTEAVCLKAVERNGDALRLVLSFDLFEKIASKLSIEIEK